MSSANISRLLWAKSMIRSQKRRWSACILPAPQATSRFALLRLSGTTPRLASAIAAAEQGLLIYLPQEGRGIGLAAKLQAYALQDQGFDTIEANEKLGYPIDARDYSIAIEILRDLNVSRVRLLTNNPKKIQALTNAGISVERVPLEIQPTTDNVHYLQPKLERMGHILTPCHTTPVTF